MEANIRNLKKLFGHSVSYRIPVFQRPYAWTEETQWLPLWEDVRDKSLEVMKAAESGRASTLYGSNHSPISA